MKNARIVTFLIFRDPGHTSAEPSRFSSSSGPPGWAPRHVPAQATGGPRLIKVERRRQ